MGNAQSEAEIKTDKDKISDMFIAHVTVLDTCHFRIFRLRTSETVHELRLFFFCNKFFAMSKVVLGAQISCSCCRIDC